jgi:hypothetical protein
MKTFLLFVLFMLVALIVIVLAIILGDSGAWYLAWLIGTSMMVLVTAAGGAMLDTQEEHAAQAMNTRAASKRA